MARRLPVLLLLLVPLALPASANAGSKTVKLRVPHDGNLSLAQYRVTVGGAGAPTAKVKNAARLGDTQAIVSVTKLRGRSYEVTIFAMNPAAAASASQVLSLAVAIRGVGVLTVRQLDTIPDVLDAKLDTYEDIEKFCRSKSARAGVRKALVAAGIPKAQAKKIVNALRVYLCQKATREQIVEAWRTLEDLLDLDLPPCFGTVSGFQGSPIEIAAHIECMVATQAVALYGPPGTSGTNCLGPPGPGSACSWAEGCSAFDGPETVCFSMLPDGFPVGSEMTFNARYSQEVVRDGQPRIFGEYLPKGATSIGEKQPIWLTG